LQVIRASIATFAEQKLLENAIAAVVLLVAARLVLVQRSRKALHGRSF
jgi:hypothetical protein